MNAYLSDSMIFFPPTEEIRALDGKRLTILDGQSKIPATISVRNADPDGLDAGKCYVSASHSLPIQAVYSRRESGSPPPTAKCSQWGKYLSLAGVESIRLPHADEQCLGEVVLPEPGAPEPPAH